MLSHEYKIVIDCGAGAPINGKDVLDSLNATRKYFLTTLMTTVKIPDAYTNNSQMAMYTKMSNIEISIAGLFQKNTSYPVCAHGLIDNGK